ncbi:uncharacterized protein [Callorhinus ursinus]|uniref:uncharacterized protein n=1 Tax=Callorhinus ursinus TaxID=34884 RepID=UPI003CD01A0B
MVGYSMEGGRQRTAPCRLGSLWGVTCWVQVGEVKDPGVRGPTGLTGAPDGAGPTWGKPPAPFSPPSPANRPQAAAPASQQLCFGALGSVQVPALPLLGWTTRERESKPRLREVKRRAPRPEGRGLCGRGGARPHFREGRVGVGEAGSPAAHGGVVRGAVLGRKARPTYLLAALHRPANRAPRARFRVRPRGFSASLPRPEEGLEAGAGSAGSSPPPASGGVASASGPLRSARSPGPASWGSSGSAAAFLLSSKRARRPAELGGCCPQLSGAPAASATGLAPPLAVALVIPHRGTRDMSLFAPLHTGESKAQKEEIICRGPELGSEPRSPGSRAALSHPLALPAEPQFPNESCPP